MDIPLYINSSPTGGTNSESHNLYSFNTVTHQVSPGPPTVVYLNYGEQPTYGLRLVDDLRALLAEQPDHAFPYQVYYECIPPNNTMREWLLAWPLSAAPPNAVNGVYMSETPFAGPCGGQPNPLKEKSISPTHATTTSQQGSVLIELETVNGTTFTATATGALQLAGSTSTNPLRTFNFDATSPQSNVVAKTIANLAPARYVLTVTATDNQPATTYPFEIKQPLVAVCDLEVKKTVVVLPDVNPKPPKLGTATGELRVTATSSQTGTATIRLRQGEDQDRYEEVKTVAVGGSASGITTFTGLASGIYLLTAEMGSTAGGTPCQYPKPVGTNAQVPLQIQIFEPDLEIGDQLTFLPWVQSELAAAASTGASGRPELTLSAQLRTSTATDKTSTVLSEVAVGPTAAAQIYGAGDVLGVNLRAILGTTPMPGATGASALQLAAIEFQEEDLPWRYSTRRASDANNTPAPWLFLLVLKASEYARPAQGGAPLPSVKVLNSALYPDPDARQQAQWAHVQLNAVLGTPPATTATTLPAPSKADINTFLHDTLPAHPALAYSRVFCPRRLEADTAYRAFLLPATEAGRLAGLGLPFTAANASEASFPTKTIAPDIFPIYFEWEFETGAADDFEDLAQQLHQANGSTRAAVPATLGLTAAGQPYELPMPALLFDADGTRPAVAPVPYPVAKSLWQQLAPTFTAGLPTAVRPLVAPPLYGRAYMVSTTLEAPASPATQLSPAPVIRPSWKHQVNLDPRYRALAAAGAQVVQDNQEDYVRRAWEQVQDILLANDKLRGAQYGLRTTAGLRDQHLPLLTTMTTGGGTNLTASVARFSLKAQSEGEELAQAQPTETDSAAAASSSSDGEVGQPLATPDASLTEDAGTTLADYGLHLTAMSLSRIRVKKASPTSTAPRPTLRETIRQSSTPLAAFSPTFRRINNPYGKYQVAQAGRPLRATQVPSAVDLAQPDALITPGTSLRQRDGLFRHLTAETIGAAAPRADEVRANQFNDDVVDRLLKGHETELAPSPASPLHGNNAALARFQTAYQSLRNDVPHPDVVPPNYDAENTAILGFRKVQRARPPLDLDELKDDVVTGTQPGPVFTVRVQQVAPTIPAPGVPGYGDFEAPDFNADHFYVGDFDEPALPAYLSKIDFSAKDFKVEPYPSFNQDPAPAPTPAFSQRLSGKSAASLTATATVTATTTPGPAPVIHTDAMLPFIKQAKVFPVFKEAMGEALRQRHPELFVPGLGEFPSGGIAVLDVNQAFIEAYMVGLNHALGSELRWRGFPVEPRATFFQQFWDVSEHLNSQLDPVADAAAGAALESSLLDIKPLDKWVGAELGDNAAAQSGSSQHPLRLALRSELLRRYPSLVIGLLPSALDTATGQPGPDPDPDHLVLPRQRLAVGQDLAIVCFDMSLAEANAQADSTTGLGAYYLVLLERPGQPRFGLDAGTGSPTTTAPLGWDALSWDYLGTQPGANITFDFSKLPHATAEPQATEYLTDSAVVAYALFQEPILLAVPVHGLLV